MTALSEPQDARLGALRAQRLEVMEAICRNTPDM
jgi:hypothetical protein